MLLLPIFSSVNPSEDVIGSFITIVVVAPSSELSGSCSITLEFSSEAAVWPLVGPLPAADAPQEQMGQDWESSGDNGIGGGAAVAGWVKGTWIGIGGMGGGEGL